MAWLSILGLYEYDNTIFDNLVLPPNIDKELVIKQDDTFSDITVEVIK